MKTTLLKLAAAVVMLITPAMLPAQADQIISGYASVALAPAFLQQISTAGIVITDLAQNPLQNGVNILPSVQGVIDLQDGNGGLIFKGGYQISFQEKVIRIEDIVFDINGPAATFSGIFIVNGKVRGRQELFLVNQKPNFSLPLHVQNGTVTLPELSLGLAPAFIRLVNQAVGQPVLNPGTQVGTASAFPVVTPDVSAACK